MCDSASCDGGVERVAHLTELHQPQSGDGALELLGDGLEPALERLVLAGPVDGVEHVDDRA